MKVIVMNKFNAPRDDLFCKYCGKSCKNLNSLRQHECRCSKNPSRIITNFEGNNYASKRKGIKRGHPWNYGLTAKTDERVKRYADKVRGTHQENRKNPGKANTIEGEILRRQKISQTMKLNKNAGGLRKNSGIGKKGKYKGYYCDSTYELVYIIYNLDHDIMFERCNIEYEYQYNNQTHKYHPDFILEDGSLVEIKGYMTELVNIKLAAVTDRPIKLLLEKDLKYAFDYVRENYLYNELTDLYDK